MNLENVNILDLVIILGAIQGILFSIFLWFKPLSNRKASFFLSLFILGFSFQCIFFALETLGIRGNLRFWDFSPLLCNFLFIGAFYFFIHFLIHPKENFNLAKGLVFLPFMIQLGFQMWGSYWSLVDRNIIDQNVSFILEFFNFVDYGSLLMGISVISLSLYKLRKYENDIKKNYAEISDFSLRWLYVLILFLLGILVLFAIPTVYNLFTDHSPFKIYYPTWITSSVMIYWIAYSAYQRNPKHFPTMFHKRTDNKEAKLSDKTIAYHQSLIQLMEDQKLYLDQELSLQTMADKLGLSCGYLSQIINQHEEMNFFDFVNGYRVEAVKSKILDPKFDHLNFLGIAHDSGFKSKSTFNLAFKKLTGQTPSAFKKSIVKKN